MPATRKVQNAIQNQDLNQLKNLFGGTGSTTSINNENMINAFSNSNNENIITDTDNEIIDNPDLELTTEDRKEVSDTTTVGIRMSTAKKREMKTYFIQHGITMSQGVLDAFSLLKKLEDDGFVAYKDGLLEFTNA